MSYFRLSLNHPQNSSGGGFPVLPVDVVFDWTLPTGLAHVSDFNASVFGGVLNNVAFDSGGTHDPSTAFKGTLGNLSAFRAPVNLGGTIYFGNLGGWTLTRDATVSQEEAYFSDIAGTHTKLVWAGFIQFNINPSDNTGSTDLDQINVDMGGGGGFVIGQEDFSTGHGAGIETGNPTAFGARPPIVTGKTYWFNLYLDAGTGHATWVLWSPSDNWNQIGLESTAIFSGTTIVDLKLCSWNTNTIIAGNTKFGSMIVAYDSKAVFPFQAVLGLRCPDNISATSASYTSLTVSWTAVSQALSYNVDISSNGGSTWSNLQTGFVGTSTTATGLTTGTSYIFRVSSNLAGGLISNYGLSNAALPATIDMLGWWKLGEGNTALATDSSGNGFNGTFPNNSSLVTGPNGGNANKLTATGACFLNLGSPSGLVLTASMSVHMWINFTASPTNPNQEVISKFTGTNQFSYTILVCASGGSGGNLAFTNINGGTWPNICQDTAHSPISHGTWHAIGMSFDAANKIIALYLDGVQIASAATTDNFITDNAGAEILIGTNQTSWPFNSSFAYADFAVGDVRIWNRALPSAEFAGLVTNGAAHS